MTRVAVLGAGSWGTAFSVVAVDAGASVTLWARRPRVADAVQERHENPDYLPGVRLPDGLTTSTSPADVLTGAEVVVLAVPAQRLRENLVAWGGLLPPDAVVLSLAKGIELGTCSRMSEIVVGTTAIPPERVVVLTGPNLAREIADRQPSASVFACTDEDVAVRLQATFRTASFRPYTNTDVIGCEVAGAVKNVIALAVGMAGGMGLGDNAKAGLVTRGLSETARLGAALGASPLTFAGLAGLGDLVATCYSPLSRNRGFGERLGRGADLATAMESTAQTAEGVRSAESVLELAGRHGVDMPITEQVVRVVRDGASPREAVEALMGRTTRSEL